MSRSTEGDQAIYDGQKLRGSIARGPKGWTAYTTAGRKIGRYPKAQEAARAVLKAVAEKVDA